MSINALKFCAICQKSIRYKNYVIVGSVLEGEFCFVDVLDLDCLINSGIVYLISRFSGAKKYV